MQHQTETLQKHELATANALNILLANEFVLYLKTRKAHWNVTGADFYGKHVFFESQYQQLEQIIDELAERIRISGHFPVASLSGYLALTQISEQTSATTASGSLISDLLQDHNTQLHTIYRTLREVSAALTDSGIAGYLSALAEKHEKMAWMLRAHLSGSAEAK